MKSIKSLQRLALIAFLPLTFLLGATTSSAQPGKQTSKGGAAIKHAELILGKPLSATQKQAVRAAQKQRQQAIKPIQQKYSATVAKALGLTVAQYEEREKALRQKNKGGAKR